MTFKRPSIENMSFKRRGELIRNKNNRRWYGHAVVARIVDGIPPENQEVPPQRLLLDLSVNDDDAKTLAKSGWWGNITVISEGEFEGIENILYLIRSRMKGRSAQAFTDPDTPRTLRVNLLVLENDSANNAMLKTFAHQITTIVGGGQYSYSVSGRS